MSITPIGTYYNPFYTIAKWKLKFLWCPRICVLSGKRLWLCYAYEGTASYVEDGEQMIEIRHHNTQEHLIWQLKRG